MSRKGQAATRFVGLDVHKHYLVATGVDGELNQVLGRTECSYRDWNGGQSER